MYTVIYEELRKAVCIVPSIKHCCKADCFSCSITSEWLDDAEVRKCIAAQKFKDCKLPVETAICDNFKGSVVSLRKLWEKRT